LWRSLGLSNEQIERFEQIMYNPTFGRVVQDGVIQFSADDQTLSPQERGPALRSLLGDAGYEALTMYNQGSYARGIASNLASLMTGTDAPLTPGQAQQLSTILTNAAPLATASDTDWANIAAQAQALLSPPQMEMLNNLRVQAVSWQKVSSAIH